ncbi:hypothetical protein FL857_11025 [Criibacterium bergeronii]|uniref:Uncharacterized protein n=1 Tax=Criibacterium bergeronii TaxID=1871336 RepID=A0A552UWU1_9FIRM|nr:hypothetical protein [Criibacterium bergeronii]TRW22702.1 hypothetical protein FL857_11025 [Criibacterium bergeronii]
MGKIKIYLDYHCYPVWVYNEKGELIDNNLPEELINDKEVDEAFTRIQDIYDNLFIDNSIEFGYKGFSREDEKEDFLKMIENAINIIMTKLGTTYLVENNVEV